MTLLLVCCPYLRPLSFGVPLRPTECERSEPSQYYQIIVSSVNVNQGIKRLKSHEYGYGGIAQIFLKLIVEKLVVFRAKMWAKMAKEWFHRKRAHIFFIFWHGIQ